MQGRISSSDNERLTAPFSMDELHNAVFSIHPDKAPGWYRFTEIFFTNTGM
ncbi:conserved hypothetical protein [Ricinus communis]|uniref:Uncharacterized protein n=1 Tax=Ricinus communis TaxID=3988 RepID=B9SSL6_RICCO|nr:conserved hypothetical protein [Ricinus communis]